jgi:hypothetical protein
MSPNFHHKLGPLDKMIHLKEKVDAVIGCYIVGRKKFGIQTSEFLKIIFRISLQKNESLT